MKREDRQKLKVGNWVRVHWRDIQHLDEGWIAPDEVENTTAPVITAGYVFRIRRNEVLIAMSWGTHQEDGDQVGNSYAIPLGCIEKVEAWP